MESTGCCRFCFNLKSRTIATAVFILVTRSIALLGASISLAVLHSMPVRSSTNSIIGGGKNVDQGNISEHLLYLLDIQLGTLIAFSMVAILVSTMLLFAVSKSNRCLFFPWFVYMSLEIVGGIFGLVLYLIYGLKIIEAILSVGLTILNIYLYYCVSSYYNHLFSTTKGVVLSPPYPGPYAANCSNPPGSAWTQVNLENGKRDDVPPTSQLRRYPMDPPPKYED